MVIKIRIKAILEYLIILALVLNCRSVYTSLPSLSWFRNAMFLLLLASVVVYIMLNHKVDGKKFTSTIFTALFLPGYLLIYLFVTRMGSEDVIQLGFVVVLLIAFYNLYCNDGLLYDLLGKYVNVIVAITFVSLIFWVLASNLGMIPSSGELSSTWVTWKIRNYYYLYFEVQSGTSLMQLLGLTGYRNTAIFNEAPMFSFHLTMALMIQVLLRHDYDKRKLAIIILGIVTSFSTTGYIVLVAVFLVKFIVSRAKDKVTQLLKWFMIPLIAFVIINVVVMLLADKLSDTSGLVRLDDIQAWLSLWKNNIVFGAGYGTQEYINYLASWRSGTGVSNSIVMILGYGGIWLMALYFIPCIEGLVRAFRGKDADAVAFIVIFLFIFAVTVVPFQYLTFFLFIIMKDGFKGSNTSIAGESRKTVEVNVN